ncbi:family 5 extracellular solute-binding protein [Fictibacillus macauensis ZFHKF-1]|uniref:Family 5 extracellular solute-binding protein n=1 Tax=Fictibacillus macauensis ZFHKF-1 TaxID=1196324 RepID=I8UCK5_9BACL|nr:family 5 extracellular solute-binding protein [Fictibacillus macauensis ZFHKF-1]
MKKSLFALVAFILILSLGLAGCNSSKTSSDGNGKKGGDGGGVMIYGKGGDAVGLDPAHETDGESFIVTEQIFEPLLSYKKENTDVQPGLAKSWEISKDNLKYTLKLEEGIKFHDGTDFNAEAVVKNFERWMNGDAAKFPYYASMFGGYKKDKAHVIKEVKAVDKNTVQFTLKRPQAPFLKNLAMSPFAISSPAAIEKYGDKIGQNPVGTGPFKFKEWKRDATITVVKNDSYWKKGLPKLDGVTFKVIKDNSARMNALTKGEVDLIDNVNPSELDKIKSNNKLQVFERPSMNVAYLGFNTEKAPFNKKEVRQAINYLVNKDELIKNFYNGTAEAAATPLPSAIAGQNKDVKDYGYNETKAKELLKKAGLEKGFKMDLWAMPVSRPYMPDGKKIAEAIQANLKKVNIDANIVTFDWGVYLEKIRKGESPAFLIGWTGDNGDADNFLYSLLDKDTINSNNYSRYNSPAVHKLLIEAQSTADEAKREVLYKKAEKIIHEDAPWVPLVHAKPILGGTSKIKDFYPHPKGSQSFVEVSMTK